MVQLLRLLQNGSRDQVSLDSSGNLPTSTTGGAATLFHLRKFTLSKGNARSFALIGYLPQTDSDTQDKSPYFLFFGYKKGKEKNIHKLPPLQLKKANKIQESFYGDIIISLGKRHEKITLDSLRDLSWKQFYLVSDNNNHQVEAEEESETNDENEGIISEGELEEEPYNY